MIYFFNGFQFDTRLYSLCREGRVTPLRPKVFQVLLYLLQHCDRVVSKQELSEQVWSGQFISDAALEGTIRLLRRALQDTGRAQQIIQTVYSHGYRFIAQVTQADETPASGLSMPSAFWRCSHCQHVNIDRQSMYCTACGVLRQRRCQRCGAETTAEANFCGMCGMTLGEHAGVPLPDSQEVVIAEQETTEQADVAPEYRQLTVMSCDLVDTLLLPEQLGLEAFHDVIQAYQNQCARAVTRFGGHIAHNLGTQLVVYFGYPFAHEDNARRAAHAGLEIVEGLKRLQTCCVGKQRRNLAVCVSIHTGLVIVESVGSRDRHDVLALGDTSEVVAQLRRVVEPNTVIVSETTATLLQGYFSCQELGVCTLDKIGTTMRFFHVLRAHATQDRLDFVEASQLTPFVGRSTELSLLLDRWGRVSTDGVGQAVLISGEAGIGKSRLIRVMRHAVAQESYCLLWCRGSPYHQQSAFFPIMELCKRVFEWQAADSPEAKLRNIEAWLAQHQLPLQELLPLFAAFLDLPVPPKRYADLQLTPQQQRQKTLAAVLQIVLTLAEQQLVLLVVEDLHWLDPSSQAFLTLVMDQLPTARLYVLLTHRPAFNVPWRHLSDVTQVAVPRLSDEQVAVMAQGITGGKTLPRDVIQRVIAYTSGVPLFVEELIKSILETDHLQEVGDHYELISPLPELHIPTTLRDSLMARLDRLGAAKRVAQLSAVLGRQFSYDLLRAVLPHDNTSLLRALEQLVRAELICPHGLPPSATYVFKHALVQETAYQSLLKSTRQTYHQRTAQVLVEQFPETAERHPELLAHHYTEAGMHAEAVSLWLKAGQQAMSHSANTEALAHLTKGLALLNVLPGTSERDRLELIMQTTLGAVLMATKGYAAPEVEQAYTRARLLYSKVEDPTQLVSVLRGQCLFYLLRAQYATAREIGEEILKLAVRDQNPDYFVEGHLQLGMILLFLGGFKAAFRHLKRGRALYDPERHRVRGRQFGADAGVGLLLYGARALWFLGYPERALNWMHEGQYLAQQLSFPLSKAQAFGMLTNFHQTRRDFQMAQEWSDKTIAYATEQGLPYWAALGTIIQGRLLAEQGDAEMGIRHIHRSLAVYQTTGAVLGYSWFLALLAEAYGKNHQPGAGLDTLSTALAFMRSSGERYYEAELYRLKGELTLQDGGAETEAEACFQHSLTIARRQHTKTLELRTATSLARLWWNAGKQAAARELLASCYAWFTEGFDTPDLQDARHLLHNCHG